MKTFGSGSDTPAIQAGAAAETTTPPLTVSLDGQFRDRQPVGVLSELAARALVLDGGDGPVALLTIDACRLSPEIGAEIAEAVAREAGVAPERLVLTCTHTHASPALFDTPWFGPDRAYLDELVARAARAVARAREQLRPARIVVARGEAPQLAFNRRFRMRDGSVLTNPAQGNPDVVAPLGPVDGAVDVLRIEDRAGGAIAHLVTYACHVAVVTDGLSGDYPEVVERALQARDGVDAPMLFAMGCAGDVNHVDVRSTGPKLGQPVAERIGAALADELTRALDASAEPVVGAELRFGSTTVALTLRRPVTSADAEADAGATLAVHGDGGLDVSSALASAYPQLEGYRDWRIRRMDGPELQVVVQALALGPVAYVALPGEIFVELGLELKRRSPFPHTLIGTLNTSADSYIGTRKAYEEGGYEVVNSLVVPGSGEQLVDAAVGLLEELHAAG